MNRFHVHISVDDLDANVRFYRTLFGAEPSVLESDYAKWMLDDPRVNFAISQRGRPAGIDHLGLQVDSDEALADIGTRLHAADAVTRAEKAANCCYARSDKFWAEDPQGVRWESFRTLGSSTRYGEDTGPAPASPTTCCGPAASGNGAGTRCCG